MPVSTATLKYPMLDCRCTSMCICLESQRSCSVKRLFHVFHRSTVPGFERTMVLPDIRHESRSDEEYANMIDEDHLHGRSPLSVIMGLVSLVPFECMHSVCLGNVKKIYMLKWKENIAIED